MTMLYDTTKKKKATSVTINEDLLRLAKEMNINISGCLESSLEQKIREEKAKNWQEENKEFIEAYNTDVEKNGVFGDDFRSF
jgi:antitoxin CcdA